MAALKRISGIILCVFAILLMSHNAGAISPVFDVSNYELQASFHPKLNCTFNDSSLNVSNQWYCQLPPKKNLQTVYSATSVNLQKDDVVSFQLVIFQNQNFSFGYNFKSEWITAPDNFVLLSREVQNADYYHNFADDALIPDGYIFSKVITYTYKVVNDISNASIGIGTAGQNNFSFVLYDDNISAYNLVFAGRNFQVWRYSVSSEDEVAQKELDSVENIENQSADDYEMQSANMSSLFSQFGGFITAVSGAHVGDCNIPANLNHINLGILNLCDNPVPDYAQVAVSIIVCMLIAPYLLNIIKRIIGIADKVREV